MDAVWTARMDRLPDIQLNPDGTVTVFNSWEDHGQGADIGTLTMAHETLREAGITPDMIKLVMNDTALTPASGPAGGINLFRYFDLYVAVPCVLFPLKLIHNIFHSELVISLPILSVH